MAVRRHFKLSPLSSPQDVIGETYDIEKDEKKEDVTEKSCYMPGFVSTDDTNDGITEPQNALALRLMLYTTILRFTWSVDLNQVNKSINNLINQSTYV